jgi:hypothetical protein
VENDGLPYPKIAFSGIEDLKSHPERRIVGMIETFNGFGGMRNIRALNRRETHNNGLRDRLFAKFGKSFGSERHRREWRFLVMGDQPSCNKG